MVGESTGLKNLRDQIERLARSLAPILIVGEAGVGKQVVAKQIHQQSPRNRAPFLEVECDAIEADQLDAVFFGKAGAFRGAASKAWGGDGSGLARVIEVMDEVSRTCMSTGFMVWCQAVCGLYMQASGNPALAGDALMAHATGRTLGGTAMSNPMKSYAQIESLLLKAVPVDGGYLA